MVSSKNGPLLRFFSLDSAIGPYEKRGNKKFPRAVASQLITTDSFIHSKVPALTSDATYSDATDSCVLAGGVFFEETNSLPFSNCSLKPA